MPNINNWLNDGQPGVSFPVGSIIGRDVVQIVISRGAVDLAAQCVRVVPVNERGDERGATQANNTPSSVGVIVIGDVGLNIKKDDLFVHRSTRYKVVYVHTSIPGHVQAECEGTQ